jgi:hypothetical protein
MLETVIFQVLCFQKRKVNQFFKFHYPICKKVLRSFHGNNDSRLKIGIVSHWRSQFVDGFLNDIVFTDRCTEQLLFDNNTAKQFRFSEGFLFRC